MSSDEAAADAPDPEHAAFVRLPAGAASDGRDRVMSRAARELRTRGTAHSAVHGHPGFVPDDYLAGLGPQTAITAAGPCTAGLRERVPCGYRVPGGEAIEVCIDRMRELRKTPGPAPGNGNGKTSTTPTWRMPCWQPAMRGVAERRPRASNWWHQEDSRRVGAAARHRLALACPYPRGLGWGDVRPSGRGAGHVPRLARRESLRDRARVPVRARRRQQRGDDRRRRRDQEEPHPVRPVHDRRSSGRHPGQPLTRLPAGQWTG